MKKADDILKEMDVNIDRWPDTKINIIVAMKVYAQQACEEQLKLCDKYIDDSGEHCSVNILNAPQPQLL